MKKHDCSKVVSKIFLALDGELSKKEEEEFLEELKTCSKCLETFQIEESFKKFLIKKIERKAVNPSLIITIKKKIKELSVES